MVSEKACGMILKEDTVRHWLLAVMATPKSFVGFRNQNNWEEKPSNIYRCMVQLSSLLIDYHLEENLV